MEDIPKPDPSKESIRDKVLQESQRRQNDLLAAKNQEKELEMVQEERLKREQELSGLTADERELKKQQDKWRRDFERE